MVHGIADGSCHVHIRSAQRLRGPGPRRHAPSGQSVYNPLRIISDDSVISFQDAVYSLNESSVAGKATIFVERASQMGGGTHDASGLPDALLTITRSDFEILLDFNRDIAFKVLWGVVRLLSERLRTTNDNLRSLLAMSMF